MNSTEKILSIDDLFDELDLLYYEAKNGIPLSIKTFEALGSRESGKTYRYTNAILKFFFNTDKTTITYIFRKENRGKNDTYTNLCNQMKSYGIEFDADKNFHKGDATLKNGNNRIIFRTINDTKIDIKKGEGAGLPTWNNADFIIAFYEECSHMKGDFINLFNASLRGSVKTQIIRFYASNPWDAYNWYVKEFNRRLPENEKALTYKGYQKKIHINKDKSGNEIDKVFMLRNSVWINPYVSQEKIDNLKKLQRDFIHQYRIQYLGLSGNEEDNIYVASMKHFTGEVDENKIWYSRGGKIQGGVDWGNGTSTGGSPTTMHIGHVCQVFGLDVFAEKTVWNNKGKMHTDVQIYDQIVAFYIYWYERLFNFNRAAERDTRIDIYIDDGWGGDMSEMCNSRAACKGYGCSKLYFHPAKKILDIKDRIDVTNYMLASKTLRIDEKNCPELVNALKTSFWNKVENNREGMKRTRDHDSSHWLNSGVEYILGYYTDAMKRKLSTIYTIKDN